MSTTITRNITRTQAEAALAAIKTQFRSYCATNAEIAAEYADDPELVALLTTRRDGSLWPDAPQPKLVENFEWTRGHVAPFAIVWEEGPYEWVYSAFYGGTDEEFGTTIKSVETIPGVASEAYTSWALALYPA